MNKFVKKLSKKFKRFRRDYNSNWNIFLVCIAIIMIRRGVWNLLEIYFLKEHPFLSNIICVGIGILILLVDDGRLGELQEEGSHKEKNLK